MGYPTEQHDFYCINCGKKGMPLARKLGKQKGKWHRKKLFCLNCKMDINHIECRNQAEVDQFKQWFAEGKFIEEAKESINFIQGVQKNEIFIRYVRLPGRRKIYLGAGTA